MLYVLFICFWCVYKSQNVFFLIPRVCVCDAYIYNFRILRSAAALLIFDLCTREMNIEKKCINLTGKNKSTNYYYIYSHFRRIKSVNSHIYLRMQRNRTQSLFYEKQKYIGSNCKYQHLNCKLHEWMSTKMPQNNCYVQKIKYNSLVMLDNYVWRIFQKFVTKLNSRPFVNMWKRIALHRFLIICMFEWFKIIELATQP